MGTGKEPFSPSPLAHGEGFMLNIYLGDMPGAVYHPPNICQNSNREIVGVITQIDQPCPSEQRR